jgi:hypothetical protein
VSQTLDPQEIYETEVKFLSTADGGRKSPINWCFAAYRPDIKVSGEPTYHGAAFMAAPSLINPGDSMIVELAFWCCDGEHDQFVAGKDFGFMRVRTS